MDFKKLPHLIILVVNVIAMRFLVLELDLQEKLAIDGGGQDTTALGSRGHDAI